MNITHLLSTVEDVNIIDDCCTITIAGYLVVMDYNIHLTLNYLIVSQ